MGESKLNFPKKNVSEKQQIDQNEQLLIIRTSTDIPSKAQGRSQAKMEQEALSIYEVQEISEIGVPKVKFSKNISQVNVQTE